MYKRFDSVTTYLPGEILRPNNASSSYCIRTQDVSPATTLTGSQGHKIIHHACTKDPVSCRAGKTKAQCCHYLDGHGWSHVFEICDAAIVNEVEDADTGEGSGDDVREDIGGGARVHCREFGEDVV